MEKKKYSFKGDIDSFSIMLIDRLREKFETFNYTDKTFYDNKIYKCQIDTYEIYSLLERGYIIVNIYLYEKKESDIIEIKVSLFSPTGGSSLKEKKILTEIEKTVSKYINEVK